MSKLKPAVLGLLSVVLIALAAAAVVYVRQTRTPEHALKQVARAVETRDRTHFSKYVDTGWMAARVFDVVLARAVDERGVDEAMAEFGLGRSMGRLDMVRTKVVSGIQQQILGSVELGEVPSAGSDPVSDKVDVPALAKRLSLFGSTEGGAVFEGFGAVRVDGSAAKVKAHFRRPLSGDRNQKISVILGMKNHGSRWRVMEISNYGELLDLAEQLSVAGAAEVEEAADKPPPGEIIKAGADWPEYVQIASIALNRPAEGILVCDAVLQNISDTEIFRAELRVFLTDEQDQPAASAGHWLVEEVDVPLAPGEFRRVSFPVLVEGPEASPSYNLRYAIDDLWVGAGD